MLFFTTSLLVSCFPGPQYEAQTLPSGRKVKILGVVNMNFGDQDQALMLKYYTDAAISDRTALQTEAEDIWQSFKVEVERAGLKTAILSANEIPHGIISKTSGFNFVFKKGEGGDWALANE
jgi:hypothetical protein